MAGILDGLKNFGKGALDVGKGAAEKTEYFAKKTALGTIPQSDVNLTGKEPQHKAIRQMVQKGVDLLGHQFDDPNKAPKDRKTNADNPTLLTNLNKALENSLKDEGPIKSLADVKPHHLRYLAEEVNAAGKFKQFLPAVDNTLKAVSPDIKVPGGTKIPGVRSEADGLEGTKLGELDVQSPFATAATAAPADKLAAAPVLAPENKLG